MYRTELYFVGEKLKKIIDSSRILILTSKKISDITFNMNIRVMSHSHFTTEYFLDVQIELLVPLDCLNTESQCQPDIYLSIFQEVQEVDDHTVSNATYCYPV